MADLKVEYFIASQEDEETVSSEVIDDDDAPAPSRLRSDESIDPDWVPCDMKGKRKPASFTPTYVQREWIKPMIPAADRACISDEALFYVLKAQLVGNGVDLNDVFLSPSLIKEIRREVHLETGAAIKVCVRVRDSELFTFVLTSSSTENYSFFCVKMFSL